MLAPPLHLSGLLAAQEDKYEGIIIDHQQLPTDAQEFGAALQQSLQVRVCEGGGRGGQTCGACMWGSGHFRVVGRKICPGCCAAADRPTASTAATSSS